MDNSHPNTDSRVVIVGASVLGLSTALHLASRGYDSITLLDRRPDPSPCPSPDNGASIQPTPYAPLHYTSPYHALSLAALTTWAQWNESLWSTDEQAAEEHRLYINNGFYTLFDTTSGAIPNIEIQKMAYLERRHGLKLALLASSDPDHVDSATSRMFCMDPFQLEEKGGGILDTLGGTILVDPAWSSAVARVRASSRVTVQFGETAGCVNEILFVEGEQKRARGVKTLDGATHNADFVIWACDPLPNSMPRPHSTQSSDVPVETEILIRISQSHNPDLWDRLGEDNCPSWKYAPPVPNKQEEGILLGFPRDAQGYVQIVWRGTPTACSQTDPAQHIRHLLTNLLPDLAPLLPQSQTTTRRFANRTVVDRPPSTNNILLALDQNSPLQTFMFLPVIGSAVVDVLEGKPHAVRGWKWPREPHSRL